MFAPVTQEPRTQSLDNSNRTTTLGSRYAAFLAASWPQPIPAKAEKNKQHRAPINGCRPAR